jgi:hypothetical protein
MPTPAVQEAALAILPADEVMGGEEPAAARASEGWAPEAEAPESRAEAEGTQAPPPDVLAAIVPEEELEVETAGEAEERVLSVEGWDEPSQEPEVEPEVESGVAAVEPPRSGTQPPTAMHLEMGSSASEAVPTVEEPSEEGPPAEPEAAPATEVPAGDLDADGAEGWIAALEAEAGADAETPTPAIQPPTIQEIDLEPEPEALPAVEPTDVVRIEDRDAAGNHEPAVEGAPDGTTHERGKLRWSLFRRGGSR